MGLVKFLHLAHCSSHAFSFSTRRHSSAGCVSGVLGVSRGRETRVPDCQEKRKERAKEAGERKSGVQ